MVDSTAFEVVTQMRKPIRQEYTVDRRKPFSKMSGCDKSDSNHATVMAQKWTRGANKANKLVCAVYFLEREGYR